MEVAFSSGKYYFNTIAVVGTCAIFDYFTKSFHSMYTDSISNTLHRLVYQRNSLENADELPSKIENILKMYEIYEKKEKKQTNKVDYLTVNVKDINKVG